MSAEAERPKSKLAGHSLSSSSSSAAGAPQPGGVASNIATNGTAAPNSPSKGSQGGAASVPGKEAFKAESQKVVDLLQRPFALLPMASDLPRLTNIRVVDENGRSAYEQPPASAPTLAKLRYTFVALTALLLDDEAVEATQKVFDEHFVENVDVSKLSMERYLEKIGGDDSPVVQVLKAVNQSAISPAIIHLKLKLGLANMTKDVRDSWYYEVLVSGHTGQVVVASHKRDQSIKNEYQYEWIMAVHFDRILQDKPAEDSGDDPCDDALPPAQTSAPSHSQSTSQPPTSSEQPASDTSEHAGTGEAAQESTSNSLSPSTPSTEDTSSPSTRIPPPHSTLANSSDTNISLPSPEKVLQRKHDFGYKCTDASLTISDLMFSLALHTSQQAKRAEISKILEPYALPDVMELASSRNWEFFTASAMAELHGAASVPASTSTLAATSAAPAEANGHVHAREESQSSVNSVAVPSSASPVTVPASGLSSLVPPPIVQGVKEYDNGDRYEGGLRLGIREGSGKYLCHATGVLYEGGYKDGKRHGEGKYVFATGARVEGVFQRGVLVTGRYSFPNGDTYSGDFKDDKFEGQGEWKGASGDEYKGAWKAGKRHGIGAAKLGLLGDSYAGEFQNDLIHGFGKYFFQNGDLFNGQFAAGHIHGVGEYTFAASNKVLLGEFAHGKLVKSSSITNVRIPSPSPSLPASSASTDATTSTPHPSASEFSASSPNGTDSESNQHVKTSGNMPVSKEEVGVTST